MFTDLPCMQVMPRLTPLTKQNFHVSSYLPLYLLYRHNNGKVFADINQYVTMKKKA
jgi:hypothetical protein